ncbi:MAG: MerR family transcriptional regulator [Alphaproteobacteria bacterium]|nr:MerR family transcriptional regulator [Alphaproteobacteria bacterium]
MMLRIGEFSRLGRVSVKALRHYEAIGLLKPHRVDGAAGYRYYAAAQIDDLHRLMVLRALGLPLERIRQVLREGLSPDRLRVLLDERRAAVARRIDAEQAQLAAIEARIRQLESRAPAYDVVVRDVPAAFVASLRRVVPEYGAIDSLLDELGRSLPAGARVTGHGAVWHHCAPQRREIDCEALVILDRPAVGLSPLKAYQLPACRAACIVHPSDEEDIFAAKRAVNQEAADRRFELEGPIRERYFSSAGDGRFDLTEIQFPLRPASGVAP